MGQPITVIRKPTRKPGILRFEINRSLTGMGHETYRSAADALGDRPPDVLARKLFEHGEVALVHVYSNEITIDLSKGASGDGIEEIINKLFTHYLPGVVPSLPLP